MQQVALAVLVQVHEVVVDHVLLGQAHGHDRLDDLVLLGLLAGQHHGHEGAVPAAGGDLAVGGGGVVVDAVALPEVLHVVADAHQQLAGEDQVELLAGVGVGVDGLVLQLLGIAVGDPEGLGDLLAEQRRQVADLDALLAGGDGGLALAGDGVGAQVGAAALDQVGDVHAEDAGAVVDEGEGQVGLAGLVVHVGFHVQLGLLGHVDHRIARDLAQGLDSGADLVEHAGHLSRVHGKSPPLSVVPWVNRTSHIRVKAYGMPVNKKTRLTDAFLPHRLRRVAINPRYHSNCAFPRPFRLHQALSLYAAFTGSVYCIRGGYFGLPARKGWACEPSVIGLAACGRLSVHP